jgi:hypothetical protein
MASKNDFQKLQTIASIRAPTRERSMRKCLEITIRSDERMTAESDTKGKEMAKGLRRFGMPAHIRSFGINRLRMISAFAGLESTLKK